MDIDEYIIVVKIKYNRGGEMNYNLNSFEKEENFFEKCINLYGREKRGSFFKILLLLTVLAFVLIFIVSILSDSNDEVLNITSTILGILFWWFGFVFGLRRARDAGFRGRGYFVVTFFPLVGIIIWFLPTNFFAREKDGFFFRKKDDNNIIHVMPNGYYNKQNAQQSQINGYGQVKQMSGEQNIYATQQYIQPQQGMQAGYANQQYAQSQHGIQEGHINQQFQQQAQVNVYMNQQYPHSQQISEMRNENLANINIENIQPEEKLSVFGDKQVNLIRKEN